jgi:hypothetical protein
VKNIIQNKMEMGAHKLYTSKSGTWPLTPVRSTLILCQFGFVCKLPVILWFEEVFKEIGNLLGLFYITDNSFRDIGYRGWLEY